MKNIWSKNDELIIKTYYNKLTIREIAKLLNKPYQAVSSKVGFYKKYKSKGLRCPTTKQDKEDRINLENNLKQKLINNINNISSEIVLNIKHKPHKKPKTKVPNLWNDNEIEFLKNNYLNMTRKQIADYLNKTDNNVRTKLIELNLKKTKKYGPSYNWTTEEDKIINLVADNNLLNGKEKMALLIDTLQNRNLHTIYKRIGFLNLRKKFSRTNSSHLETIIKKLLNKLNVEYVEQYLIPNTLYKSDFLIKDSNLIIEVLGDYWHCNPKIYTNGPKDEIQKRKIEDDIKKDKVIKNLNLKVLYIWEYDIYNNYDMVKNTLINNLNNANGRS